jgi:hypothetical protein
MLTLRTILLSGTWAATFGETLTDNAASITTYADHLNDMQQVAA